MNDFNQEKLEMEAVQTLTNVLWMNPVMITLPVQIMMAVTVVLVTLVTWVMVSTVLISMNVTQTMEGAMETLPVPIQTALFIALVISVMMGTAS